MGLLTGWETHHPRAYDLAGYIPWFVSAHDPRPAREQLDTGYAHGGGWQPMAGWELLPSGDIRWEDEVYQKVCTLRIRNERVVIYQHAWVAIIQDDGSFEVARVD